MNSIISLFSDGQTVKSFFQGFLLAFLLGLLLSVAIIDIRKRIIPNLLCLCFLLVGILFNYSNITGITLLSVALISIPMIVLSLKDKLGAGDVKLLLAVGITVGTPAYLRTILFMSIFAIISYLIIKARKNISNKDTFALAPSISAASAISLILM